MTKSQRLELTWMGKDVHPRLEPRILLEDPALSYCATTKKKGDIFDNRLNRKKGTGSKICRYMRGIAGTDNTGKFTIRIPFSFLVGLSG